MTGLNKYYSYVHEKLFDKLHFVACVVKESKANGLEDQLLTVKVFKVILCS